MAPHPVLLAANLFSWQTQLGLIVFKSPSKSQGEFVDRYFSFKCGVNKSFLSWWRLFNVSFFNVYSTLHISDKHGKPCILYAYVLVYFNYSRLLNNPLGNFSWNSWQIQVDKYPSLWNLQQLLMILCIASILWWNFKFNNENILIFQH